MRHRALLTVAATVCLLISGAGLGKEIHLPANVAPFGDVIIAEAGSLYEMTRKGERIPQEFQVWPGKRGMRSADWFDVRIEADRGDVIVLARGRYQFDLWVFAPGITITTHPDAEEIAEIWGTVEIDTDNVTLDRIAVTGPPKNGSSGHGIEINREVVNRVTIRNCRIEDNEWYGIHVIGVRGAIGELRVENCQVLSNGSYGIEAQSVRKLVITGCTVTGNSEGVHVGSHVDQVEMHDNEIWGNRDVDVYRKP